VRGAWGDGHGGFGGGVGCGVAVWVEEGAIGISKLDPENIVMARPPSAAVSR